MTNRKPVEYIWHCSRRSCSAIVLKTIYLELNDEATFQCRRCLCVYTGLELMSCNKRNIRKFATTLLSTEEVEKLIS
jgi:hypothetical protein